MPILKNAKHELFAQKCAKGMAADAAYAEVYPNARRESSRRGSAAELRAKPIVAARISELQSQGAKEAVTEIKDELVTINMVLKGLLEIAQVDIGEAFDNNGELKPIHQIPITIRRAISGIEVDELFEGRGPAREKIGLTKKVKFWDKTKSWELLGKHLQMFSERIDVRVKHTLEDLVAGAGEEEPKKE